MFNHMYNKLTKNMTGRNNLKLDERILVYSLSNGDPSLWPDLCATNIGAARKYVCLFSGAKRIIEKSGVEAYMNTTKSYLVTYSENLMSNPALYPKILNQ